MPLKTRFDGVRVLPGASRGGALLRAGTVLMPSFVNIGGYVDSGTMVDTWATVGSCAQIGKNVHLAGGVGIGGVLEPPNAEPVVVEDDAMICRAAWSSAGARVRRGSILGAGAILHPDDGHRRRDRRGIPRGHVPRGCVASAAPGCGSSLAASSACRACWCSSACPKAPGTTSRP